MNKPILLSFLFISYMFSQNENVYKKSSKALGISETEVRSLARSKGLTESDIKSEAVKAGYILPAKDISNTQNKKEFGTPLLPEENSTVNTDGAQNQEKKIIEETGGEIEPLDINNSNSDYSKKNINYYGYDIFKGDPSLFQASNLGVIDPSYGIGSGDEIIIMLWGETQSREIFTVTREGYIFLPNIGQVFVSGLTLEKLEKKLLKLLSKIYSSLRPNKGNPTTYLDVSLGKLRSLRIMVLGEVSQPGSYYVSPSTTLFTSLYYFRGPTKNGTLRDIQLIRDGKNIASIDYYNYLLNGKAEGDVKLQLNDLIFIPKRGKTVSISGEVNRDAYFEIKGDENLVDLIDFAGGLNKTAYLDRAPVYRIVPFEERKDGQGDRVLRDIDLGLVIRGESIFKLRDGDDIYIYPIMNEVNNIVYIEGTSVSRPGGFQLISGMKLKDLVEKAGGLSSDTYYDMAHIIRLNKENLNEQLIKVNLNQAMLGDAGNNIELLAMDKVRIFNLSQIIPDYNFEIKGHVKSPGVYKIYEDILISDALFKYGGFLDKEWSEKTLMSRFDLSRLNNDGITRSLYSINLSDILNKSEDANISYLIEPGDIITIYPRSYLNYKKSVLINGAVKKEGRYELQTDMTLLDLILSAGGFKNDVYNFKLDISRIDPQKTSENYYAEIISFDINENKISSIEFKKDKIGKELNFKSFYLKPYDIVSVRPDPHFSMQKIINIEGEVLYPGEYSLKYSNETIRDIIMRAGGLSKSADLESSSFIRDGSKIKLSFKNLMKNKNKKNSLELKHNDKIIISQKVEIVTVSGEVNNPGNFKYIKGNRLRDYIKISGGFTENYNKNSIYVNYPNGFSKKWKKHYLISPKIKSGSEIIINKKPDEEPIDKTELAKEIASILSDFVQVIALFSLAR